MNEWEWHNDGDGYDDDEAELEALILIDIDEDLWFELEEIVELEWQIEIQQICLECGNLQSVCRDDSLQKKCREVA
jgi:hypothetical protein